MKILMIFLFASTCFVNISFANQKKLKCDSLLVQKIKSSYSPLIDRLLSETEIEKVTTVDDLFFQISAQSSSNAHTLRALGLLKKIALEKLSGDLSLIRQELHDIFLEKFNQNIANRRAIDAAAVSNRSIHYVEESFNIPRDKIDFLAAATKQVQVFSGPKYPLFVQSKDSFYLGNRGSKKKIKQLIVSQDSHDGLVVFEREPGKKIFLGVELWDLATKKLKSLPHTVYTKQISTALFSPDGQTIAFGTHSGEVLLLDQKNGELRSLLEGEISAKQYSVESLAFSPDHKTLAVSYENGIVDLWEVSKVKKLRTIVEPFITKGRELHFSPDGSELVMSVSPGAVFVWDTLDYTIKARFVTSAKEVASDLDRIVSLGENNYLVYNAASKKLFLGAYSQGQLLIKYDFNSLRNLKLIAGFSLLENYSNLLVVFEDGHAVRLNLSLLVKELNDEA